jgi:hypothetical protein
VKSWQIFLIGAAAVVAALFLPRYEPVIEGAGAIAIVAVVAFGFSLRPRRDVFYVRTTVQVTDLDRNLSVEHDQIAVRVELARLWLLFLPTFLAVAFLVVAAANGTLWSFSLLNRLFSSEYGFDLLIICRMPLLLAVGACRLGSASGGCFGMPRLAAPNLCQ